MACDICMKTRPTKQLSDLLAWKRDMVICDSCARKADKMLDRYRDMAWVRVKRKLKKMQKEATK